MNQNARNMQVVVHKIVTDQVFHWKGRSADS